MPADPSEFLSFLLQFFIFQQKDLTVISGKSIGRPCQKNLSEIKVFPYRGECKETAFLVLISPEVALKFMEEEKTEAISFSLGASGGNTAQA